MKKKVTKIKKTKVTLESLNDNLEKFQSLVVQQFERSWLEFSNIKTEIIDIKKQIELVHSELAFC